MISANSLPVTISYSEPGKYNNEPGEVQLRFLTLILTLLLAGCASVPLATKMKLAGFDHQDFFLLAPEEIRVKASINSSLKLDLVTATQLSAMLESNQGPLAFNFPLEKIKIEKIPAIEGFFSDTPAFDVYYLKLTPEGIADFKQFQQQGHSGGPRRAGFSAGLSTDHKVDLPDEDIYLSIGLKLSDSQDYFPLIDNWQFQ